MVERARARRRPRRRRRRRASRGSPSPRRRGRPRRAGSGASPRSTRPVSQVRPSIERRFRRCRRSRGMLVVDLTRYLPGAVRHAGAARARRPGRPPCEPPDGDPMRSRRRLGRRAQRGQGVRRLRPQGRPRARAQRSCARADVVVESFRPGVADAPRRRPGATRRRRPSTARITGFGLGGPHEQRAGHDLNYVGWAGAARETRRPGCRRCRSPTSPRARSTRSVAILAALLVRERTGRGRARGRLDDARRAPAGLAPARRRAARPRCSPAALACYRIYAMRRRTAPDRRGARAGVLRDGSASCSGARSSPQRQYGDEQEELAAELAAAFAARPLAEWLELFDGEDVCVGPGRDARGGRSRVRPAGAGTAPPLGAHTDAWRRELGVPA